MNLARTRMLLAIFLFSVGVLALELTYTKFFSVILWYHFGFLIVSSAMLGFAVAGVLLALLGERANRLQLTPLIHASVIAVLASYLLLTQADLSGITKTPTWATITSLIFAILILFLPFLFMGLTISWAIARERGKVGAVYAANLLGSGLGAVVFLLLFNRIPGEMVPMVLGVVLLAAGALAAENRSHWLQAGALALLLAVLIPLSTRVPIDPARYKVAGQIQDPERDILYSGWNASAKVDIFQNPDVTFRGLGLWGLSAPYLRKTRSLPERLGVIIDANAYTTILRNPQDLGFYEHMPTTFPFHLGRDYGSTLHIGAGGGMDLLAAHHYGVPDVTGVEINSQIVDAVANQFREFTGGLYAGGVDGVRVHLSEGRSFIEHVDRRYDMIQLSGVDTSASSEAGAFALSENYLYTVESFVSYLEKLEPGGILTLTRLHLPDKSGRKTVSLRLISLVRETLQRMGIDPRRRVFFFRDSPKGIITLLAVGLEPFTREQIKSGLAFIRDNQFVPMVLPGRRLGTVYEDFLYASHDDYLKQVADYPYKVNAPTDDQPFFFEVQRLGTVFRDDDWPVRSLTITGQEILLVLLGELALVGFVLLILPGRYLARRRELRVPRGAVIYFSAIGFAYIAVEIVLAQRMVLTLGHPSYALSVVIAGMLVCSGVASALSARLQPRSTLILGLLVVTLLIVGFAMRPVLGAALQLPFAARLAVCLAWIAPLAFLMGLPFPMGVRWVNPEWVPYLWAVNGFFSVMGSVCAVLVSINLGFSWVFAGAAAAYLLAATLGVRAARSGFA